MKVTIVGVGLMGGSLAMDLRKTGIASRIVGVDRKEEHLKQAMELGFIDESSDLSAAISKSDLIVLAIPVDAARKVLIDILDQIPEHAIVIDLGSSKQGICEVASTHHNRSQYVACHPIAGTEFTGPSAAHHGLFDGKVSIICNREESSQEAISVAERLFKVLNMTIINMNAEEHDRHIAYVSHLSHVTSFTLGLTVLDIEKNEKNIFNMAGSGFESTVRLAKSSPEMWGPIFRQNADNLLKALDAYMEKLSGFRKIIAERNVGEAEEFMMEGNEIRRILEGIELKNKEPAWPEQTKREN
ncbi:MAG: prephenate dehydrogenase [Cytophagales bacterium]|nr:prephenate dehydrogenase [Cytophagales bacterium]